VELPAFPDGAEPVPQAARPKTIMSADSALIILFMTIPLFLL